MRIDPQTLPNQTQLPPGIRLKNGESFNLVHFLAQESEAGLALKVLKVAKSAIALAKEIKFSETLKEASNFLGAVTSTFNALGVFGGIKELYDQSKKRHVKGLDKHERNVKIASSVFSIAIGVMSGLDILDRLRAIEIARMTQAIGRLGTFGAQAAIVAPFSNVFAGFQVVSSSLAIGVSSIKLAKLDKKEGRVKQKTNVAWNRVPDERFASNRIMRIKERQVRTSADYQRLLPLAQNATNDVNQKIANLQNAQGRRAVRRAKKELKASYKTQEKLLTALKQSVEKHNAFEEKVTRWSTIRDKIENGTLTDADRTTLETFRQRKIEKYDIKKGNIHLDRWREGLNILFHSILIVAIVASVVLALTGIGAIPAVAIAISAIFLYVSVYGISMSLFKRFVKDEAWKPVEVPNLPPAQVLDPDAIPAHA